MASQTHPTPSVSLPFPSKPDLADESYYTLQPFPDGAMPRSVKELREALAELSATQLRELMLAEAKTNAAFAGAVFAAFDRELFMRLNTVYDFGHLVEEVQREMITANLRLRRDVKDQGLDKVSGAIDGALGTMLEKGTANHASDGTKSSAVVNMCKIGKLVALADPGPTGQELKKWFTDSRGNQLVRDMMEVLARMDMEGLDKMTSVKIETVGTFVEQAAELEKLDRDSGMFAGLDEVIELLTSRSPSSEEDWEDDEGMGEDTPTTPQPGDSMSVLFMDE